MQVGDWLKTSAATLKAAGIATARLDAIVLLEDALCQDRAWLLAHPDFELKSPILENLDKQIRQRAQHIPLAYIRGKSEFYGRVFLVTPATLQPRPETETMVDLLKLLHLSAGSVVADIGTGSGAIAITAKLELPQLIIHGVEIQPATLAVAHKNRGVLGADITLHEGNLLEPLMNTKIDAILANLPYVPNSYTINPAALQEPRIAIFGGSDGLDLYRELFKQAADHKIQPPQYILTESLPFQHQELAKIAEHAGYTLETSQDFIQIFRAS